MRARVHQTKPSILDAWLFGNASEMPVPQLNREPVKYKAPQFDERLLYNALFNLNIEPESLMPDFVALQTIGYIPEPDEEIEPPLSWTNDGVEKLHSVLLYESISILAGKGNAQQKREVLEWIFEPDYIGEVIKDGVPKRLFNWEVPWSFLFCCRIEQMHHPEIIRDFIRNALPEGAAVFFK
jgi:hypothetical protein